MLGWAVLIVLIFNMATLSLFGTWRQFQNEVLNREDLVGSPQLASQTNLFLSQIHVIKIGIHLAHNTIIKVK